MTATIASAKELCEAASTAALCDQIDAWLPTFKPNEVDLFNRIVASKSGNYASHHTLPMDDLRNLYDLCRRSVMARERAQQELVDQAQKLGMGY